MEFDSQKYKLYVNIALLYFEKQKVGKIFNSYNTRLTTINENMKGLLDDINEFKTIDDTSDEKGKLFKLIDLVSKDNNNIDVISNEIKVKCNNINVTNDIINKTVDTNSKDFNFIKTVCKDELSIQDKNIIEGDLFHSSASNDTISDLEKIKRDEYNRRDVKRGWKREN
jgi:hypothetical protein